jgi:hypothetical protein
MLIFFGTVYQLLYLIQCVQIEPVFCGKHRWNRKEQVIFLYPYALIIQQISAGLQRKIENSFLYEKYDETMGNYKNSIAKCDEKVEFMS